MKIHLFLIKTLMIASLILSVTTQAEETQAAMPDNPKDTSNAEGCDVSLLQPPQLSPTGEVLFLSGGTCSDSVSQIKNLAAAFSLEVVLVERTDEYDKESYIAAVVVNIKNKDNIVVLNVVTEGPYLLVDLPDGPYQITAEFNGVVKERKVIINKSKHSRTVLLWDNRTPKESQSE